MRFYTVATAAEHMGVSEWTIRNWVRWGRLHPVPGVYGPDGKTRYFTSAALVDAERASRAGRPHRTVDRMIASR